MDVEYNNVTSTVEHAYSVEHLLMHTYGISHTQQLVLTRWKVILINNNNSNNNSKLGTSSKYNTNETHRVSVSYNDDLCTILQSKISLQGAAVVHDSARPASECKCVYCIYRVNRQALSPLFSSIM